MGMLVTLVKAMGASNKWMNSAEQELFLCFNQESDFHHQLYCFIFITKWTFKEKVYTVFKTMITDAYRVGFKLIRCKSAHSEMHMFLCLLRRILTVLCHFTEIKRYLFNNILFCVYIYSTKKVKDHFEKMNLINNNK